MAAAGLASRRVSEDLISEGQVTVNGSVAELGDKATWNDYIEVDGVRLTNPEITVHYLVNKPVGVVSTASDPQGRPTVVELVMNSHQLSQRLFPVGRLDADSEGVIIVTNDGELTHLLTHPSHGVVKEYLVQVQGRPSRTALRKLREGVELDDGLTAPARVSQGPDGALSIVIHEGKNRQIRRMCEAVGHRVQRLVRTRIGPISQDLAPGESRRLTQTEVRALYATTNPDALQSGMRKKQGKIGL